MDAEGTEIISEKAEIKLAGRDIAHAHRVPPGIVASVVSNRGSAPADRAEISSDRAEISSDRAEMRGDLTRAAGDFARERLRESGNAAPSGNPEACAAWLARHVKAT
jgi:hypothetical protein